MFSQISIFALLCGTPLAAEGLGPTELADLGYVLDGFQNSVSKMGQTEDSEHFEIKLSGGSTVRVSFEYSVLPHEPLFDDTLPYAITVRDGVDVILLGAVGQALCVNSQHTRRTECLVLTESFFAWMFDENSKLDSFPYIHFVSDDIEIDTLKDVVSSLRRVPE